jgi:hypothetical protein
MKFITFKNINGNKFTINPEYINSIDWGQGKAEHDYDPDFPTQINLNSGIHYEINHTDPLNEKALDTLIGHRWSDNLG